MPEETVTKMHRAKRYKNASGKARRVPGRAAAAAAAAEKKSKDASVNATAILLWATAVAVQVSVGERRERVEVREGRSVVAVLVWVRMRRVAWAL